MTEPAETRSDEARPTPGPLAGVRVVDLSVMISGPLAGMMLADQGADVVKVESPGLGDLMRLLGTAKGGMTGIFANNNRGKRSIVVDLKQPAGLDVVQRLVERADVLIQNFRPGALERLGLGYEAMLALNPDLVYVSISGYGPDGPNSHRRVYDNVIQAASAIASVQTDPLTGVPTMFRTLVCDKVTAYTAAQAITAALYARAMGTARGQHVVLSMLDAAIAFMWPDSGMDAVFLDDDVAHLPTIGQNYAVTQLADGYMSAAAVSDAEFRGLCAALGRPDIPDDARFADPASRTQHLVELVTALRDSAARVTLEEFARAAEEYDVPASKIVSLDQLPHEPQVIHNQMFVERRHPAAGMLREPRPAARFSSTPASVAAPAPMFGQHSDDIVREVGLDPDALRAAGAIA